MTLEDEYKKETNQNPYDIVNCHYKDSYVEWLENKIDTLIDNCT